MDEYPVSMAVRGTSHHRARLDQEKVRYIRAHTELSNADLARMFGVTRATIRAIRANAAWHDPNYTPAPSRFWGTGVRDGEDADALQRSRQRTLEKTR
jgi:hypothetical protein